MDFLKRILIIALCSVLLVCACPTFSTHSEAAEAALTTEFLRSAIGYLSGYLVSKGYSIAQRSNFDIDDALTASFGDQYQLYKSFMDGLGVYSQAHKELLQSALERAYNSGVFSISEDLDTVLTNYFDSLTVDSSLTLGSATQTFEPLSSSEASTYSFTYIDTSVTSSPIYSITTTVNVPFDYLPILNWQYSGSTLSGLMIIYVPVDPITSYNSIISYKDQMTVSNVNSGSVMNASKGFGSIYQDSRSYYYLYTLLNFNTTYPVQSSTLPDYLSISDGVGFDSIFAYFKLNGVYDSSDFFKATQIEDTSDKDILSSASEVDPETGTVSGGFTMYMRDWSLFQQILKQFSSGILSWTQAIKALGLSQVSSDATPAQKETALDKVAYPDSTYDWFTTTTWDNGITQTVKDEVATAHETELDIADELAETLNGGNDPSDEDKNKAGNAMLLATLLMYLGLWDPPGFDPDDPQTPGIGDGVTTDPTKPNMLVETLTGMGVAGGFINDLWDSVGGSQGLGIIFTVGASFVVFSVIIGGSNYLGSLQSPDVSNNIDISKERSKIPQNNVPLLTTSKKSRRRK